MDNSKLSSRQREIIADAVARRMLYVERLIDRMQRTGFPSDDVLYLAAVQARESLRALVTVAAKVDNRPQWQRAIRADDGRPSSQSQALR